MRSEMLEIDLSRRERSSDDEVVGRVRAPISR